jgi:hypothetical protein
VNIHTATIVGPYRYWLVRKWAEGGQLVNFIMLNPSTADAMNDDPTIRRCTSFAKQLNFSGLVVTNLFALRATSPAELKTDILPIGPENDAYLRMGIEVCSTTIAAWGAHGTYMERDTEVRNILRSTRSWGAEAAGSLVMHLGLTKSGQPKHPLYLPKSTVPQFWSLWG